MAIRYEAKSRILHFKFVAKCAKKLGLGTVAQQIKPLIVMSASENRGLVWVMATVLSTQFHVYVHEAAVSESPDMWAPHIYVGDSVEVLRS